MRVQVAGQLPSSCGRVAEAQGAVPWLGMGVANKRYVLEQLCNFQPAFNMDAVDTQWVPGPRSTSSTCLKLLDVGRSTACSVQCNFESYPGPKTQLTRKEVSSCSHGQAELQICFHPSRTVRSNVWIMRLCHQLSSEGSDQGFDTDLSPCKSWRRAMKTTTVP